MYVWKQLTTQINEDKYTIKITGDHKSVETDRKCNKKIIKKILITSQYEFILNN